MKRRIIDIHTHIFPDEIAARAVQQLAGRSGETAFLDGTAAGLEASMRRCGIDLSVTQPVSTKASQVASINAFAIRLNERPGLINFGTLFPDYDGNAAEIGRMKRAGLKGVKFHPDYQAFYVDEERMFPLYRQMAAAGLIAFFHAGVDIGLGPPYHGNPDRLVHVLERVPELAVVAAHFGGFEMWDDVEKYLVGKDLYFDTSFTLSFLPANRFVRMARKHGIEKILFGTDSPWAEQDKEIALVRNTGLADAELSAVFHDNAARLLGI
ncbi:MAG: amidohydrolase family protein [Verrucomicrobiota bacterium]